MAPKDVRPLLAALAIDAFVSTQEVPKSADRKQPGHFIFGRQSCIIRPVWREPSAGGDMSLIGYVLRLGSLRLVHSNEACSRQVVWFQEYDKGTNLHVFIDIQLIPRPRSLDWYFLPVITPIAWTDTEGVLSRWHKAVPNNFPDPLKTSIVANSAATVPSYQKNRSESLW